MIEDDEQETIQSVKQPNFLIPKPEEIKDVVLLSKLSKDNKTKIKSNFNSFKFEESLLPELKPLAFTVGENFFDLIRITDGIKPGDEYVKEKLSFPERKVSVYRYKDSPNNFIELRGLLQFVNNHEKHKFFDDNSLYKKTIEKHIELQFPANSGFEVTKWEREDYGESEHSLAKTKIHFYDIESVLITRGWFERNIVIKLKPERYIHRLAIDKIEREIVLTVERKDFKLANQVVTTILTQINEIELRKILK